MLRLLTGRTLGYGAVAGLRKIATPTAVARRVMEKTDHVFSRGQWRAAICARTGL